MTSRTVNGRELILLRGDITELDVDAIVNAANSQLQLGAGVAGAIRSRGGPSIQRECDRIGGTPVGTAVITGGGELPAKHVIHAVGPRMGEGDEERKLRDAVLAALQVASDNSLARIALPAISTGIYGFPLERAAEIIVAAAVSFLQQESSLTSCTICLFGESDYQLFADELQRQLPK